MADETMAESTIESTSHIPIAELSDSLDAPETRSVKAIVTLTWPYSSATGSVAFLLAEPDFRLRRSKGQVRVQFSGSSAKYISKAGISSGDEVILCLDGAEWLRDESEISTPGRGVEWELKFTERLQLQFRQEESQEVNLINIDHPTPELEAPRRQPSPELAPSPSPSTTSIYSRPGALNGNEWSSPAFMKRARTSYGSLFDSDYDPFAEADGSVRGKGRKRTRLSSTWRYSSRSPTPELEETSSHSSTEPNSTSLPVMEDEGCQTIENGLGEAAEALADFSRQATATEDTADVIELEHAENEKKVPTPEPQIENDSASMAPPTIQTHTEPPSELPPALGEAPVPDTLLIAPQSPQLRPISSDALPLVSPLVTSKYGLFTEVADQAALMFGASDNATRSAIPDTTHSAPVPPQTTMSDVVTLSQAVPISSQIQEDPEDLYGVSPIGHHGEQQHMEQFHERVNGFQSVNQTTEDHYIPEDQYGHWQSEMAQFSGTASPQRGNDRSEDHLEEFHVEGAEDGHFENVNLMGFNDHSPYPNQRQPHQYPDPDDELMVPSFNFPYNQNQRRSSVAYPELPDPEEEVTHPTRKSPYPPATLMSRSQSAHSEVVDLTESDNGHEGEGEGEEEEGYADFEDEEVVDRNNLVRRADDEEMDGSSVEGSVDEEPYLREGPSQSRYFQQNNADIEEDEASTNSQLDDDDAQYRRYSDDEEAPYDEEERGSNDEEEYDEDEDEPEEELVPKAPVFIDLLSSDGEDEEVDESRAEPVLSHEPPRPTQENLYQQEDDESESDGEGENESVSPTKELDLEGTISEMLKGSPELGEDDSASSRADSEEHKEEEEESDWDEEHISDRDLASEGQQALYRETHGNTRSESPGLTGDVKDIVSAQGGPEDRDMIDVAERDPSAEEEEHATRSSDLEQGLQPEELDGVLLGHPTQAKLGNYPDIFGKPLQPQNRDPIYNQVFNMDGANDSRTDVIYPTLSRDDTGSTTVSGFAQHSQSTTISLGPTITANDIQLPTPDETQTSQVREAQVSFSFTTGIESTSDQPKSSEEPSIDPEPQSSVRTVVEVAKELVVEEIMDVDILPQDVPDQDAADQSNIPSVLVDVNDISKLEGDPRITENRDETANEAIVDSLPIHTDAMDIAIEKHLSIPTNNDALSTGDASDQRDGKAVDDSGIEEVNETIVVNDNVDVEMVESLNANDAAGITAGITTPINNKAMSPAEVVPQAESSSAPIPVLVEKAEDHEQISHISPRRSKRIGKSSSTADSTEIVPPVTPTRTRTNMQHDSVKITPPDVLNEIPALQGHDPSIEMALSALDSPPKQQHDLRRAPIVDLKIRLGRILRTELSEYTSLKVLRYHLKEKLDVLAIATTTPDEPQRAKGGPRHYQITFNITDPSIAPSGVTECQIHRPYKDALPIIKAGDGILLRNFQVVAIKDKGFALHSDQNEASSWAVFKEDEEVEVRGPPVEYEAAEIRYFVSLMEWFESLDSVATAKLSRANASKAR